VTRLRSALAATALLLPLGGVVVATAPTAAADGCSAAEVTVLVDFASLGGGVQTGCTGGDPASGIEALQAAGFPPTRAAAERSGYFVCRIAGRPADDPCQRASPAGATWSYWHGEPGGSWTYAGQGAGSYDPAPGTVEGWSFGAGDPPSAPPPRLVAAAAPAPPAAPVAPAPAAPAAPVAPAPSAVPSQAAPAPPAPPAPDAAAEPTGTPEQAAEASATPRVSSTPFPSTARPSTGRPSTSAAADVPLATSPGSSSSTGGGLVAALAAGGVVLLLSAGALVQARRRRGEV
jgi:hypothetical protein